MELSDLYTSPSVIRIIKSRRMRLAGQVARMGERRKEFMLFVGKPEGKRPISFRGLQSASELYRLSDEKDQ
jgi:hypothetical protein